MRCVLVMLKCWESVIKLLDGMCEMAVQLSVHTLYKYGGYCLCVVGKKGYLWFEKITSSYALYLTF